MKIFLGLFSSVGRVIRKLIENNRVTSTGDVRVTSSGNIRISREA